MYEDLINSNKNKHLKKTYDYYIKYILIALYFLLTVIFLTYFIVMNNSLFILLSILFFIGLSFLIFKNDNYLSTVLGLSMALIYTGSVMYFKIPFIIDAILLVIYTLIMIFLEYRIKMRYKLIVYIALALPILLYLIYFETYSPYVINLAIIGYYLLIALVIAVIIRLKFYNGDKAISVKSSRSLSHYILIHKNSVYFLGIIIGILILVLPIYPLNPLFDLNLMPHSVVSFYLPSNFSGSNFILNLNLSNFTQYGVYNFRSIGFYSSTNIPINASVIKNEHNLNDIQFEINSSKFKPGKNEMNVYFFVPNNKSYTKVESIPKFNDITIAKNVSLSKISSFSYKNKTINYTVYNISFYNTSTNHTFYNGYEYLKMCNAYYTNFISFKLTSNHHFSIFEFNNSSDLDNALFMLKGNLTYDNYIKNFEKMSYAHYINTSNQSFLIKGCIKYSLVFDNKTNLITTIEQFKYIPKNMGIETYIPNSYYSTNHTFIGGRYSILPDSLKYIYRTYKKNIDETKNISIYN